MAQDADAKPTGAATAGAPSMDEILASIRKIISEDEKSEETRLADEERRAQRARGRNLAEALKRKIAEQDGTQDAVSSPAKIAAADSKGVDVDLDLDLAIGDGGAASESPSTSEKIAWGRAAPDTSRMPEAAMRGGRDGSRAPEIELMPAPPVAQRPGPDTAGLTAAEAEMVLELTNMVNADGSVTPLRRAPSEAKGVGSADLNAAPLSAAFREIAEPMIREWLERNMPRLVERALARAETTARNARIAG